MVLGRSDEEKEDSETDGPSENEGEDKDSDSEGESVGMSRRVKMILSQKILQMNLVKIPMENMMISVEEILGVKWLKVVSQ